MRRRRKFWSVFGAGGTVKQSKICYFRPLSALRALERQWVAGLRSVNRCLRHQEISPKVGFWSVVGGCGTIKQSKIYCLRPLSALRVLEKTVGSWVAGRR